MPNFYRMWSSQFQRWLVSLEKQDIYVSKKVKKQKAPILITLPLFLQAFWTQGIQFCSWVLTLFSTNKTPLNWIIFDTFFIHIWMIMYLIMDDFKSYTSPKKFLISKGKDMIRSARVLYCEDTFSGVLIQNERSCRKGKPF